MLRARYAALVLLLLAAGAAAAGLPPPTPPAVRDEGTQKLVTRSVVEARVSGAEHLLPSAVAAKDEEGEARHPMLKAPQRALLRATAWLRRENPTAWLLLATMLTESQGSLEKQLGELAAVRSQVRARSFFCREPRTRDRRARRRSPPRPPGAPDALALPRSSCRRTRTWR